MTTRRSVGAVLAALAAAVLPKAPPARAQAPGGGASALMLTIFLRHDETKTVDEINQHLRRTGWFRDFPPPRGGGGVLVRDDGDRPGGHPAPASRAPARPEPAGGGEAWGGYRTEFYPTYDYRALYEQLRTQMR